VLQRRLTTPGDSQRDTAVDQQSRSSKQPSGLLARCVLPVFRRRLRVDNTDAARLDTRWTEQPLPPLPPAIVESMSADFTNRTAAVPARRQHSRTRTRESLVRKSVSLQNSSTVTLSCLASDLSEVNNHEQSPVTHAPAALHLTSQRVDGGKHRLLVNDHSGLQGTERKHTVSRPILLRHLFVSLYAYCFVVDDLRN